MNLEVNEFFSVISMTKDDYEKSEIKKDVESNLEIPRPFLWNGKLQIVVPSEWIDITPN